MPDHILAEDQQAFLGAKVAVKKQPPSLFDVCIVGSGAGGGMAAYVLTGAGATVVVLEAGRMWDNAKDSAMLAWPYDSPRRGAPTKERPFGEFDGCIGGWAIEGEPYTVAAGTRFDWWRARMLGGRTNHWGRISLRFGPDDFRGKSIDGLGDDWPIGYDDIKPFYDNVDRLVGIFGSTEGLRNHPDGIFLPPPRPRCYELLVKQACGRLGVTCIPARISVITRPHNGRLPCHYCGQCNRGCRTNSNFSSPGVLLAPALATGRLTLITNAMAREVTLDRRGLASGVSYVDKTDGTDRQVRARIVVVAASACESARLLLNSKSSRFPNGLANSSGTVGKYLTDTTGTDAAGVIPRLMDQPPRRTPVGMPGIVEHLHLQAGPPGIIRVLADSVENPTVAPLGHLPLQCELEVGVLVGGDDVTCRVDPSERPVDHLPPGRHRLRAITPPPSRGLAIEERFPPGLALFRREHGLRALLRSLPWSGGGTGKNRRSEAEGCCDGDCKLRGSVDHLALQRQRGGKAGKLPRLQCTSFLYRIRCGWSTDAPFRLW